jgi:CIC family chloride channel protein
MLGIAERIFNRIRQNEETLFLVLSLIIGVVVGLTIVAFVLLTERVGLRFYPAGSPAWRRLLMPIVGSLVSGFLLYRYFPNARGSGIPQTKTALFVNGGRITLKTVVGKFVCCSTTLASGIALGREGPSVHMGAGIASVLGRSMRLSQSKVEALIPVGAAAALAAAFNTPIAAVLFSLEEVMGDLHAPLMGSVVLSSATSWMTLHLLLGDEPLFHVPSYSLVHPIEFVFYAALGLIGGLVSVWFVKMILFLRPRFFSLPEKTRWIQPAAGGLIVGILALLMPQVLGVGYSYVGQALNSGMAIEIMALLVILKVIATTTSYASGNAGGIFGPSLFIGAMTGGVVGGVAHHFLPGMTATAGAYALVGMGAAFAGIVRVPLTSVIMIFEMTRDYSIIVPLMISNLLAFYISVRLQRQPIYEALALQDGIHLPNSETRKSGQQLRVHAAMFAPLAVVDVSWTPAEAISQLKTVNESELPVMEGQRFLGMTSISRLQGFQDIPNLRETLGHGEFPHLHSDHSIDIALHRMGKHNTKQLPVVSRQDLHKLEGIVTLEAILRLYGVNPDDSLG